MVSGGGKERGKGYLGIKISKIQPFTSLKPILLTNISLSFIAYSVCSRINVKLTIFSHVSVEELKNFDKEMKDN